MARLAPVAAFAVVVLSAVPAIAGGPHLFWPTHASVALTFPEELPRSGGDGRLPNALVYGSSGPAEVPAIDAPAHRPLGGASRRFPRPAWAGARLHWCADRSAGCGATAAQLFCSAQGYRRVVEAVQERGVGGYAATAQIGSGLACQGPSCDGFTRITCAR